MTMVRTKSRFRKSISTAGLVVAAAAVSLTGSVWALSGGAGAATTTTTSHPPSARACAAVHAKLPYGQRMEASFTAKAAKAQARVTQAQKAGHTRQVAHLERIVRHDQAVAARLGHSKYAARQAARFAKLAKACPVPKA